MVFQGLGNSNTIITTKVYMYVYFFFFLKSFFMLCGNFILKTHSID